MSSKCIIWVFDDNKIQLYVELRKQWSIQKYNGNIFYSVESMNSSAEDVKGLQEEFIVPYIEKISKSVGIQSDTYINALFIYDTSNEVMHNAFKVINTWIDEHNKSLSIVNHEWSCKELKSIIQKIGPESILMGAVVGAQGITHGGVNFCVTTSEGSSYVIAPIDYKTGPLISSTDEDKKDEQVISRPIVSIKSNNSKSVYFAKPSSVSKNNKEPKQSKHRLSNNITQIKAGDVDNISKQKITDEELKQILEEQTKDYNYTVREPK